MMQRTRWIRVCGLLLLTLSLFGCVRGCPSSQPPIHINPNMDWQPRLETQGESGFFYDGSAMRLPVPGTVARGQLRENTAFYTGKDEADQYLAGMPVVQTPELLGRGAARYAIYCRPCHDQKGSGRGILYERGGVPTASFHDERLQDMPDGEIFFVITNGIGLMGGYGYAIPAADRWAIIAHVRRLQQERREP